MSIGDDIKKTFTKSDNGLVRLIIVNVALFIIANLVSIFYDLMSSFVLPSGFSRFIQQPWSIFTYMFLHKEVFHILFNMLWLFSLGRLFVDFMGSKRLVSVYIMGGFVGGLLYLILANTLKLDMGRGLLGASAGVMAVIVAIAFFVPNYALNFLMWQIQVKYIALVAFISTTILDLNINTGGKVAHIGGAVLGLVFTLLYKQGKDITKPLNTIIDKIKSFFSSGGSPKMKVAYKNKTTHQIKMEQQKNVDDILDKISRSGYESLTKEEKEILFKASGK